MGQKVVKRFTLLMTILLVLATALAGCSGTDGGSPESAGEDDDSGTETAEGSDDLTLSYFVAMNSAVSATMKSYNEIAAYKKAEEITGVHIDFQHPPTGEGEAEQQFNLMMASGDLPDMIEWNWLNVSGGPEKYINEGKIVKLNDYLEEHAPNLTKVLEENPEFKTMISTDDGSIYSFPFLMGDPLLRTVYGPVLRKDWLDNLGLDVPTTLDDWHEMLTAFKEQDPNGNGEADEIPLLPDLNSQAFIGAFGITPGFYHEGNTVKYGPIQPEFKEFLTLMHQWYDEGLIDPDYVATDNKLKDAKVTDNQLGAMMAYPGSGIDRYTTLMIEENPDVKFIGAPYPSLKEGEIPLGFENNPYRGEGAAITTSNEHIEESIEWLDFKYGEEGHMLFNFGIEGESYEMVDGYPTYTDNILNPDEMPVNQAMAQYFIASWSGPIVQDKRYIEQYYQRPEMVEAVEQWTKASTDKLMPAVTPTQEESSEFASIMNDVDTYKDTMVDKFIMGEEPLSQFDEYVETLKGMGIERAIEIQQAALERYNNR